MKQILPPVFFILCVVAMGLSHLFFPIAAFLSWPVNTLGVIPLLLGLLIALAGARQFKREGTNIRTFDDPDKFVTEGLFGISRNPMYLGFALAAFGAAIVFGCLTPLVIAFIHWGVLDRWYITFEEKRMAMRFGEEYRVYKNRVRRWI